MRSAGGEDPSSEGSRRETLQAKSWQHLYCSQAPSIGIVLWRWAFPTSSNCRHRTSARGSSACGPAASNRSPYARERATMTIQSCIKIWPFADPCISATLPSHPGQTLGAMRPRSSAFQSSVAASLYPWSRLVNSASSFHLFPVLRTHDASKQFHRFASRIARPSSPVRSKHSLATFAQSS